MIHFSEAPTRRKSEQGTAPEILERVRLFVRHYRQMANAISAPVRKSAADGPAPRPAEKLLEALRSLVKGLRAAAVVLFCFEKGWLPEIIGGKGAPKPTSRIVAPGTIYFFERADRKLFGEADARSPWLAAGGAHTPSKNSVG